MLKENRTYFYTSNYIDYICERFYLDNSSYEINTPEFKFFAPILSKDEKVESGNLSYLSLPLVSGDISIKKIKTLMSEYFDKINKIGKNRIALRQDPLIDYDNQIIKSVLQEGFYPNLFYTTVIDLTLTKESLWQNLRKSFRSLINGIEKNDKFKLVITDASSNLFGIEDWIKMYLRLVKRGGGNPTKDMFKNIEISVKDNLAYLYLLYNNEDRLVSGVHITFNNKLAYYAASGTDIDFEKTDFFSHYLLWNAIMDLKNKGFENLEIGPVFYNNVKNFYSPSQKELAISDFKLGIGGKLVPFIIWEKKG